MSTIEEQLWDYIDGNCSIKEQALLAKKIATDHHYREIYNELLHVQQELKQFDLDEPSLSFNRNVMEQVKLELPPVALKTRVDQRIIIGIAAVFAMLLLGVMSYILANSNWSISFKMPNLNFEGLTKTFENPIALQLFIVVDVMLGLIYLDKWLRKKRLQNL